MDTPYDNMTFMVERVDPERSGRRGADWRVGMKRSSPEDDRWASTNVEHMTQDELRELRDEIDRKLALAEPVGKPSKRVNEAAQLRRLATQLRVRADWHEPDEQGLTAVVRGDSFDNAGFWGRDRDGSLLIFGEGRQEIWVELLQEGQPVAQINLATLLAMATGYEG